MPDDNLSTNKPFNEVPKTPDLRKRSLGRRVRFRASSGLLPVALESSKTRRMMPAFWYKLGFIGKFLSALALVLILAAASAAVYFNFVDKSKGATSVSQSNKREEPKTVASPLTGMPVAPELATRPVTGIMIENSLDARPQSGIQDAGVIFEAIAEGGITRLITLFQDARPGYIGPVRSLRPYYIDWAASFDASIAHVGGSPDALGQIRNGGKDLDQFFNASSYWREGSRPSPHNVYTNFDKLDELNNSKGYTSSNFTPLPRKKDERLATPSAKTIDLNISSAAFNVHYDYDYQSNSYHRSEGGAAHIATSSAGDKTGTLLAPKVVVAMVMQYSIVDNSGHSGYGTTGSGTAYVFQDGFVVQGTWTKTTISSQIDLKDTAGNPIKLNAGQVWLTAVKDGQTKYSP